ncbi:hypothetical protein [Xanthomonas floridensis]|uniref:Uncharacterized protein n=1 Tax=Xanthomonas floridensis TaxID=1843580 RepID=A0A1A9MG19_9XANT|nr:hypothetical protein [Xanthomonas floridensis]MEA5126314.1 hypothetical protein [Xanthomonas floridensis]MEA5134213.1 hypothetical protein [Xanthomonas floridensis]OAG69148.1 hypothetical protein A7D17_09725 [Xanthomonas floridensis]
MNRAALAAGLLLIATTLPCAHAGEMTTPGEKSEFYSALAVSTPVLVVGGALASVLSPASMAVQAAREASSTPHAGTLPPMRVQAVQTLPEGAREVQLQNPQQTDATLSLRWPARQDDPATGFRVGDMVSFQPSPAGSGWTVQDPQGQALAFLPTGEAAAHNSSRTW